MKSLKLKLSKAGNDKNKWEICSPGQLSEDVCIDDLLGEQDEPEEKESLSEACLSKMTRNDMKRKIVNVQVIQKLLKLENLMEGK